MRKRISAYLFIITVLYFSTSCRSNHYDVDISDIESQIRIKRLEKDLFSINPGEIPGAVPELKRKYGDFLQLFSYVINTGDVNDSSYSDFLVRFCTDKLNNEVYGVTVQTFPEMSETEEKLNRAFRYYQYYFPGRIVPAVFTCTAGFNNSIITDDSVLGIGLDRFLGADCEYYKRLGIYKYLSDRMTPSNIVPDCIYGWGASEWDFSLIGYKSDNVITEMLHEGKLKYYQKCMMPDVPENIIFGFTPDQMKFCSNNEEQMWHYLLEHDLLFVTDQLLIRKLTGEAPFTTYFTDESPGKAAVWIGFRIVESYMMKNPGVTLEALMNETDIQSVLEKARYSPK